jgi:hypothetical protein
MGLARSREPGFIVKPKTKAHQVSLKKQKKKHGIHIVIVAQLVVKIIRPN